MKQAIYAWIITLALSLLLSALQVPVNAAPQDGKDAAMEQVNAKDEKKSEPAPDSETPRDSAGYYKKGLADFEAKRYKEAADAFKQAIRMKPDWPEAVFYLGQSYYGLNRYREASDQYKQAVRLKPDWADAHFRLGRVYYVLGKKQSSLEQYKILENLNPDLAKTLFRIIKDDITVSGDNTVASKPKDDGPKEPVSSSVITAATPSGKEESFAPSNTKVEVKPTPDTSAKATDTTPAPATPAKDSAEKKDPSPASSNTPTNTDKPQPTAIYRVGIGDILDIRLLDSPNSNSTLFRVLDNGSLEYQLAGGPVPVDGLTTSEVAARLGAELKRRAVQENPHLSVTVREYASHTVVLTGLVANPGTRVLRREAVPLYLLLAEAQPRTDAGRATIMRSGSPGVTIDLSDLAATNTLVYPNDVITISERPVQYYYIGGEITMPGQKV